MIAMLLSKKEKQELSKNERRALRKKRRAERRSEKGPFLGLQIEVLETLAKDLILELAADAIPGEEKMKEVLAELADKADSFLQWRALPPFVSIPLEILDGVLLKAVAKSMLEPLVQKVYEKLKADGKLNVQ